MQGLVLLAGLLQAVPAPAAPTPHAFIVIAGISTYADREIPARPHAEEDARALHELLADRRYLGAGKDQMRLLLGKDATCRSLLESLAWLRDKAGPDDLVLFAFFGQGVGLGERGDQLCYLAADSSLVGRSRDGVGESAIAEILDHLKSRRVCVLLDVPFTGFRTKRTIAQPSFAGPAFREFRGDNGSHEYRPLPGRLVLARQSRFAPELLAGLRSAADSGEGVVTSAGLTGYLTRAFDKKNPALQVLEPDAPPFPLVANPAVRPKPIAVPPLQREDAEKFAKAVFQVCDNLEDHYLHPDIPRLINFGIRGLYERLREPIPDDIQRRLGQLKDLDKERQLALLADMRQRLGKRNYLAENKALEWITAGMLATLDRRSCYSTDIQPFNLGGPYYVSVGLSLRKNATTDLLEVVTPARGGPADRAGLLAGDAIVSLTRDVNSEGDRLARPETHSTRDLSLAECVKMLRGKHGTRIKLMVQRDGEGRLRAFEVTRGRVDVESIHGYRRKQDGSWDYSLDAKKQIGYLRISQFPRDMHKEFQTVLQGIRAAGLKGLVLDLRCNPGGSLTPSVEVAALLLDKGAAREQTIVTIHDGEGRKEALRFQKEPGNIVPGVPLVVLVNQGSVQSAEILAACLQDTGRAAILGERTQGNGSVMNRVSLPPREAELLLTVGIFRRPSGKSLNRFTDADKDWGVRPDVEVPLSRRDREELLERMRNSEILPRPGWPLVDPYADFKDVQLEKALDHLRRKLSGR